MADETQVTIAALCISLIALFTAVSQVLTQLFATADGYRRCQAAIIGGWAQLTRRKFRWAELRYETIYTTPRFALSPYTGKTIWHDKGGGGKAGRLTASVMRGIPFHPLDGTPEMVKATYANPLNQNAGLGVYDGPSEMVSWTRLIDALHSVGADTRACLTPMKRSDFKQDQDWGCFTIPTLTPQRHSWDFLPPDVIRPLAGKLP